MLDATTLHADALVADAHNDLLMCVAARPPARWGSYFREQWLPQLVDGGVGLQVLPVFVDDQFRPEGALRHTLRTVEAAHRLAEECPDEVALCLDGDDVDAAIASGRIALVLALESAPGVDADVELLQTLFRLGVRVASLAHLGRTPLADGSAEDATGSRLTAAGVEAVGLMESLGMLYDVSHLGHAGVAHVIELATRPLIATHSCARALHDHHRNLPDEHLRAIADGGGVVCVNLIAPFLAERDASIDTFVDHVEHVVSVAGIEHVGLGPDFIAEVQQDLMPRWCEAELTDWIGVSGPIWLPGLEGPRGLPLVTEALVRRGWSEAEVRAVLGANVHRLLVAEIGRGRPS